MGKDSAVAPAGQKVTLGGAEYLVKPVKFKRVYKLKRLIVGILQKLDGVGVNALLSVVAGGEAKTPDEIKARNANALAGLDSLLDALVQNIGELFTVAIPKLNADIFGEDADDDASPDLEELWDAFMVILEVNHLEFIKNRLAALAAALRTTETPPPPTEMPTTTLSPQLVSSITSTLLESPNSPSPNSNSG